MSSSDALSKETKGLGMPWEQLHAYSQAVKVGDTVYLSGQVSHDDAGNFFAVGDMKSQMRQSYANIEKVLAEYGATLEYLLTCGAVSNPGRRGVLRITQDAKRNSLNP